LINEEKEKLEKLLLEADELFKPYDWGEDISYIESDYLIKVEENLDKIV